MSLQETEKSRWFSMEVQPHEAALRAYLHARFPMLRDADDIVQETYTRLLREKKAGRIRRFGAAEPKISARQPAGRSVIWRGRRRCGSEIFINRVHRQT